MISSLNKLQIMKCKQKLLTKWLGSCKMSRALDSIFHKIRVTLLLWSWSCWLQGYEKSGKDMRKAAKQFESYKAELWKQIETQMAADRWKELYLLCVGSTAGCWCGGNSAAGYTYLTAEGKERFMPNTEPSLSFSLIKMIGFHYAFPPLAPQKGNATEGGVG